MLKTITKVGNSQGIIFDTALMELAHLQTDDEVNLEVHAGGTITITPLRKEPSANERWRPHISSFFVAIIRLLTGTSARL
jgi:antitoxin component of MazEF toxin-antitoxin module